MLLEYPICTKCGCMLEETEAGYIVITSSLSFVYHQDTCDGTEIVILDPVKAIIDYEWDRA